MPLVCIIRFALIVLCAVLALIEGVWYAPDWFNSCTAILRRCIGVHGDGIGWDWRYGNDALPPSPVFGLIEVTDVVYVLEHTPFLFC